MDVTKAPFRVGFESDSVEKARRVITGGKTARPSKQLFGAERDFIETHGSAVRYGHV